VEPEIAEERDLLYIKSTLRVNQKKRIMLENPTIIRDIWPFVLWRKIHSQ
jgi:hypothetical protein